MGTLVYRVSSWITIHHIRQLKLALVAPTGSHCDLPWYIGDHKWPLATTKCFPAVNTMVLTQHIYWNLSRKTDSVYCDVIILLWQQTEYSAYRSMVPLLPLEYAFALSSVYTDAIQTHLLFVAEDIMLYFYADSFLRHVFKVVLIKKTQSCLMFHFISQVSICHNSYTVWYCQHILSNEVGDQLVTASLCWWRALGCNNCAVSHWLSTAMYYVIQPMPLRQLLRRLQTMRNVQLFSKIFQQPFQQQL